MRWNCLVLGLILAFFPDIAWGQEFLPEIGIGTETQFSAIPSNAEEQKVEASSASQPLDSTDLYDARTGYIHPFLSVSGYHTSNLFRTAENEQSDNYAIIVPGLWLALPARNQQFPEIGTLNTAPGGLSLSRFTMEKERRVQGYALYQANILKYDRNAEEDRIDHRGQGMLKFSARSGLSLEITNLYERNSDAYGTGGKTDDRALDTFDANLFNAILLSRLSPKVLLRADYGRYHLNYADASNSYRDRNDDSYSGYLFFETTSRTALFVQGEQITIRYEEDNNIDTRHNNYYLGIQTQTSANSRGRFKAGYGQQVYGPIETDNFLAEAQLDYFFNPKTSTFLQGTRRILESDQTGARSILSHRMLVGYRQRLTSKLKCDANLFFNRNDYDGTVRIWDSDRNRYRIASDYYYDDYGGGITLGFSPVIWMDLSLGYEYRERDSNFDSEDYQSNTVFLRATSAL